MAKRYVYSFLPVLLFAISLLFHGNLFGQVPNNQDCMGAIPVCQNSYFQNNSYSGTGNYPNEINSGGGTCLLSGEKNDVWYIFTVISGGNLSFVINPNNSADDYDWAVFNLTNANCSDIYNNNGLEVCCNYSATDGATGANGGGPSCDASASASPFSPTIPVSAGQTYVLNISNFSSTQYGYSLDFSSSSATIYDNVAPQFISVNTAAITCGTNQITFNFSENVLCSTVDPCDFLITGPGGVTYTVTGVTGAGCLSGAPMENTFTLTVSPSISQGGNYSISLVNSCGSVTDNCGNTAPPNSFNFTINAPYTTVSPASSSVCPGGCSSLTAAGATSYSWTGGLGSVAAVTACPSSTTTYTVTGVSAACTSTASVTVTVNPNPSVSPAASPAAICAGGSSNLSAGGAASYMWQPGNLSGSSVSVSPPSTTTYTVTGTSAAGCTGSATVTVTVNPNPIVMASTVTSPVCNGECSDLNASGASAYTWQPGGLSGSTVNVCPTVSTTYTVTGTSAAGCTATAATTVSVNPLPAVTLTATPPAICQGASTTVTASGAQTYVWMPGNLQGNSVVLNPSATTTYTITGTSAAGCTGSASITITVYNNPIVNATASPASVCSGNCSSLTASGASTYTWQPGGLSGSNVSVCPLTSTIYTVTGTSAQGCSASQTATVGVYTNPVVSTLPSSGAVCPGSCISISGSGAVNYTWSGPNISPASGTTVTACPSAQTTYTVTGTDANGCTGTGTVTISINPNLSLGISPSSPSICTGDSITINLSGAVSYSWNPASNISPAGSSSWHVFPSSTTTYTVSGTNGYGCTGSGSVTITVHPIPGSSFTVVSPVCNLGSSTIAYTGSGSPAGFYNWNFDGGTAVPGAGLQTYQVNWPASGVYQVSLVVTENNCSSASTVHNVVISDLNAAVSVLTNVSCFGLSDGSAQASAGNGINPFLYQWNTTPPQNGSAAGGLAAGQYIVTITDSAGCVDTASVSITQPALLTASVSQLVPVACYGGNSGSATLTVGGGTPGYQYAWSNGNTTNPGTGLTAGNYTVTVSDDHNCTVVVPVNIAQPAALDVNLNIQNESCENSCNGELSAVVSGGIAPYQYHWNVSGTGSIIQNLCTGYYSITVTDSNNCPGTATATVGTSTLVNAGGYADPPASTINAPVNFIYTGTPASTYHWDFGDGNTSDQANPVHAYGADGEYTVTVTISSGSPDYCEDTYTFTVIVNTPSDIVIPNVFTPNGDGYNDVFTVKSYGLMNEQMVIFNRWGKKIFEWKEVGGQWDGKINGQLCADGTYYFLFVAKGYDGKEYNVDGSVTLVK